MVLDKPSHGSPEAEGEHLSNPEAEEDLLTNPEEEDQPSHELPANIPKSHPKPSRSECELEFRVTNSSIKSDEETYPEFEATYPKPTQNPPHLDPPQEPPQEPPQGPSQYQKYQELQSKPVQPTTFEDATDGYTASDYYESLRAVDKEHYHTTGIKIKELDHCVEGSFHSLSQVPNAPTSGVSNPAMNDWVPNSDLKLPVSKKPSRSEPIADSWY